ncbi:hypothetical protein [Methanomassiliicoccus luminyensis]|jgi:predicted RecB family nuclease|uniref:hypothetical protein n=1 Tax=Methanomassiliicoccus luminyensis TaxID=1080712 RepID=UPI00035F975E|nr:hypothetical protein [Methanomassiliicoccus luminyensis]
MTMLIEEHTYMLGVRGKTVERLKAVDIETLEDLADAPIDLIVKNLRCTVERARVLINRAKRAVRMKMPARPAGREDGTKAQRTGRGRGPRERDEERPVFYVRGP